MNKAANITAERRRFMLETISGLLVLLEEKDNFLRGHSERVANNCANFCEEFKLIDEADIELICFAGLLHDIGLVAVPLEILQHPEKLNGAELIRVKKHPVSGEKIISNFSDLKDILPLIRHHHEAFDGSGYPDGIQGDEIPLGARIIGLFNYFDNLVFPRPSAKELSLEEALEQIESQAGRLFDKELIDNFAEFVRSNSGQSEDYFLKKEAASLRGIFSEIIKKFSVGKINPPAMPQVVKEFKAIIKRPQSTSDELARVIEKDPVITLRLIAVANSPVYRGVTEIKSVKNALPRLGLKEALNIVLAVANKGLYNTDKVQYKILMDKLWVHSLACAYGAKLIAQHLKLDDAENFFLMGLTHDIGKALLLKAFSDVPHDAPISLSAIIANLQEAHISLGSLLLKRWGYDDGFINVLAHHEGKEIGPETEKEILVLYLANMLTRKIGFSLFEEDIDFGELEPVHTLQTTPDAVDALGAQVKQIVEDVAHLF